MEFINNGEPIKIRKRNNQGYYWITLKRGEKINLPKHVGVNNSLKIIATEGQVKDKKVETKQIEDIVDRLVDNTPDDLFLEELIKINGIGKKTAKDIVSWGTKDKLIEVIEARGTLPFRDDIEEKLRSKYGKS